MQFDHIETAIETLKQGELVIVVDDEDRENEGDLVAVTEFMKDDAINFMAKYGRGLICAPISRAIALNLIILYKLFDVINDAIIVCRNRRQMFGIF